MPVIEAILPPASGSVQRTYTTGYMIMYFAARFKAAGSLPSSFGKSGFECDRDFALIVMKIKIYVTTVPNMQTKIQK